MGSAATRANGDRWSAQHGIQTHSALSHTWTANELSRKTNEMHGHSESIFRNACALFVLMSSRGKPFNRVGGLVAKTRYFSADFRIIHFNVSIYKSGCGFAKELFNRVVAIMFNKS